MSYKQRQEEYGPKIENPIYLEPIVPKTFLTEEGSLGELANSGEVYFTDLITYEYPSNESTRVPWEHGLSREIEEELQK